MFPQLLCEESIFMDTNKADLESRNEHITTKYSLGASKVLGNTHNPK